MIRADVHMPYFNKFLYIALACAGYALWSLYDAQVTYPKKLEIARAYESFPDSTTGRQQWLDLSKQNGWPQASPKKSAAEVEGLIVQQYLAIVGCLILGTILSLKWWRARGTWIEGDASVIRSSWGKQVDLENVTAINKRKWEKKGIAVLKHSYEGHRQKFTLDDYKYDREATGKLLAFAEEALAKKTAVNDAPTGSDSPNVENGANQQNETAPTSETAKDAES
ncbi:MAG: hypothetical protein AAF539_15835 [Planctomycetota bacterium]